MILYRITHYRYKEDISGEGARQYGARWNSKGTRMLYTAEHISLCALEMLVNIHLTEMPDHYQLLYIFVPDDCTMGTVSGKKLKAGWQDDEGYTHFMGDSFTREKSVLLLKVPSAVIPEENNLLVNPLHPEFSRVRIEKSREFVFDQRFLTFS